MKIHELQLAGATDRKRVGRGIGSGYGKTAGRGTKGQNSRTGGGVRIGFAGGQNPLAKQLPKKRGFHALHHISFQVVNLENLDSFKEGSVIDNDALAQAGFVKKSADRVKLLSRGAVTHKVTVQVQAASKTAIAAVEKAGGTVVLSPLPQVKSKKATRPAAEQPKA